MSHIHELIDYAVVAYIVHGGKVLLAGHNELKTWMPIGGHIELDEDPEQALWREVDEEIGLSQDDIEIIAEKHVFDDPKATSLYTPSFMDVHTIDDVHKHVVLVYVARAKTNNVRLNAEEHHELRWFTKDDLKNNNIILPSIRFYAEQALEKLAA